MGVVIPKHRRPVALVLVGKAAERPDHRAVHSGGFRTPVPIQSVHRFRSIPNSVPGFSYTLEMGGLAR
jgi:hypothetical protein